MSDYTFRGMTLPPTMREHIDDYVEHGRPLGDFLCAVIDNNLSEACGRADENNLPVLPAFVAYLYNHCPIGCWGYKGAHDAWVEKKLAERMTDEEREAYGEQLSRRRKPSEL